MSVIMDKLRSKYSPNSVIHNTLNNDIKLYCFKKLGRFTVGKGYVVDGWDFSGFPLCIYCDDGEAIWINEKCIDAHFTFDKNLVRRNKLKKINLYGIIR